MQIEDWIYDLETFPNCFTAKFLHVVTGMYHSFEISDRQTDTAALIRFLRTLPSGSRLVGFNNIGFDYPIIHLILISDGIGISAATLYDKAQSIIKSQDGFPQTVKPWEVIIPQVDLFKIHHFDNAAKRTSLKMLQFNMRSESVEDLPFEVGTWLTDEQMNTLHDYNFHDVTETLKFYWESRPAIEFRDALSARYGRDFTNHNDTKIGKDYLVMRLEELSPGSCYDPQTRQPRQTIHYGGVSLAAIIFPYIQFQHPELQRVLAWYKTQTVGEYDKPSISCQIDGFTFDFGLGGVHGSVTSRSYEADDEFALFDLDVGGFYPSLAVANKLAPAHLGPAFVAVYADILAERAKHKKGTPENAMLKLAGNGVFGDSGNPYSPYFDTGFMLSITVNGQLLLCMLAEQIMRVPSVQMIQVNTDGMTMRVRRDQVPAVRAMCDWWQTVTRLKLEENFYRDMYIRDVNNYTARTESGKVKRKGALSWVRGLNLSDGELAWHQDQGGLVIQMAAEAHLLDDADIAEYIYGHRNIFDFLMRVKVPRGSRLQFDDGTRLPNITRYYVSTDGRAMQKIMPPAAGCKVGDYKRANGLTDAYFNSVIAEIGGSHTWDARIHTKNRSVYAEKILSIEAGWKLTECNHISRARRDNIDFQYYISKARELVASVGR